VTRRILVVAAVIARGGDVLVTRRMEDAARGGQWEFPGGKVEEGESEPQALAREIVEELGCPVDVGALLARTAHRYPELEVELAFYACTLAPGVEPRPIGVAAMEWVERGALARYDFCEADLPVLPLLMATPRG